MSKGLSCGLGLWHTKQEHFRKPIDSCCQCVCGVPVYHVVSYYLLNRLEMCLKLAIYWLIWKTLQTLFPYQQVNSKFQPTCHVDRGHIKVPQGDAPKTLESRKYKFSKIILWHTTLKMKSSNKQYRKIVWENAFWNQFLLCLV